MKDEIIYNVPLADIDISDLNVRHNDVMRDMDELKASISKHGLLQPVVLIGSFGAPRYKLISGQRRYLAHEQLGLKTIRAVFEQNLDENQTIIRSLVENMQRVDLDYIDTAQAITQLYTSYGKDERKVVEETGLSLRKVREYISLDALASPRMKDMISKGSVTPADAKRALKAASGNADKAEALLALMVEFNPTTHQKKRIVMYGQADPSATPQQILEKAYAPHVEETLVVVLPDEVREAIKAAVKTMNMDAEEFALRTITEWLYENGFMKQV